MHASKSAPASIVKGDSYGNFHCPRNQYMIDRKKSVPCAVAVKAKKVFKEVFTLTLSGIFWQKTTPDIDYWNGAKNV